MKELITPLLFTAVFILIIAAVILIMDRLILKYKDYSLTINDDKEYSVHGGKALLKELSRNKIFIPSACGGKGTCGYCKVKAHEGGGETLPLEKLLLTRHEVKNSHRLACQVKVRDNLKIEIPEEYLNIKEYRVKVRETTHVTSDIRKIVFTLPPGETIDFKPGQYIQVNITGTDEQRAYSMASSPSIKESVEINVKLIPEGVGSGFLHNLKEGDELTISGPYGDFYLQNTNRDILCVAGGVGLAPLKSIIAYWEEYCPHRNIELYYGARTTKDLYDHEIFKALDEKYPNFSYFPALSMADEEWKGETGFIHNIMNEKMKKVGDRESYLCGPPIMIDAVISVLNNKGLKEEDIRFDKF